MNFFLQLLPLALSLVLIYFLPACIMRNSENKKRRILNLPLEKNEGVIATIYMTFYFMVLCSILEFVIGAVLAQVVFLVGYEIPWSVSFFSSLLAVLVTSMLFIKVFKKKPKIPSWIQLYRRVGVILLIISIANVFPFLLYLLIDSSVQFSFTGLLVFIPAIIFFKKEPKTIYFAPIYETTDFEHSQKEWELELELERAKLDLERARIELERMKQETQNKK